MNNIETREYKPNQSPERFKPVRLLLAAAVIAALSGSALADVDEGRLVLLPQPAAIQALNLNETEI